MTFKVPEAYIPKAGARVMGLGNPDNKDEQIRSRPERLRVSCMEKPEDIARKFKQRRHRLRHRNLRALRLREQKPGVSNLMSIYSAVHRQEL